MKEVLASHMCHLHGAAVTVGSSPGVQCYTPWDACGRKALQQKANDKDGPPMRSIKLKTSPVLLGNIYT